MVVANLGDRPYLLSEFLINLGAADWRILFLLIRIKIIIRDLVLLQRIVRSRALFGNMGRAHWTWSRRACPVGLEIFKATITDRTLYVLIRSPATW